MTCVAAASDTHFSSAGCFFFIIYIFSPRTHPVEFAVVVAGVGVEGAQLHPAETHLVLGRVEEPADIGSGLQGEQWG